MRTLIIGIVLFSTIVSLQGQTSEAPYITQDENVELLLNRWRQNNREQGMLGFRIQIYSASGNRSKLMAEREKAAFDAIYPDVRSYDPEWDAPYYKVRVGDFRSRPEAEKFLSEVASRWNTSYIVTCRINPPKLIIPKENSTEESQF